MNGITLMSGKELEGPKISMREAGSDTKGEDADGKEAPVKRPSKK